MLTMVVVFLSVLVIAILGNSPSEAASVKIPVKYWSNRIKGAIAVGSDGDEQQLDVEFDHSYGGFWLFSKEACPNSNCYTATFEGYSRDESTSYSKTEKKFELSAEDNLDGKLKGEGIVAKDQYKFYDFGETITVKSQEFGEVTKILQGTFRVDGIFGLCLTEVAGSVQSPLVELAKLPNIEPVFAFHISARQTERGQLIIGGDDQGFMDGKMQSHDVLKFDDIYDGWFISITKLVIKGKDGVRTDFPMQAKYAIPTANYLGIHFASPDTTNLNKDIFAGATFQRNKSNYFNCKQDVDKVDELPDIIIVLGDEEYEMKPKDYIVDYVPTGGSMTCNSGFIGTIPKSEIIYLGQMFLKKFYTRFNFGTKQIQIAKAKRTPAPGDPVFSLGTYKNDARSLLKFLE